jgi:hypothetical protein
MGICIDCISSTGEGLWESVLTALVTLGGVIWESVLTVLVALGRVYGTLY